MPIQILSPTVAAQIAAGEVVERPASVVKELLDNALDAGATRITVEARGGGIRELRVQDNGSGIAADEVELAFERHATSKLAHASDLWALQTLGFRGEALPSIASVAQIICITRTAAEEVGTELRIAGGTIQERLTRGCSPGTSITVRNLFYNTPVRRDYLRSESTEMVAITQVVQHTALAHPHVRFTLLLDGRLALQTNGSGDLRDVVVDIYGLETARQLLPVHADYGAEIDAVQVRGLISPPSVTRSARTAMHLIVNRRVVQARGPLAAVVSEAYHTMLMKGRYPIVVLAVDVHPAAVDVNIHPTKAEVKFRDQQRVMSVIGRAVRDALVAGTGVVTWGDAASELPRRFEVRPAPAPIAPPSSAWGVGDPVWTAQSRWDVGAPPPVTSLVPEPEAAPLTPELAASPTSAGVVDGDAPTLSTAPAAALPAPDPHPTPAHSSQLPPLRVIGQVGLTYIVAESPEGMYLIDQHAAHERITYERLMQQRGQGRIESQELLMPITVALPPAAAELLLHAGEQLREWGFSLDAWGEGMVRLRAAPPTLALEEAQQALLEIADYLNGQGGSTPDDWREAMLTTLACHTSVRAGRVLSVEEMRELLLALERCASPRTCPHGRPTMVLLTPSQLERQFGRRV